MHYGHTETAGVSRSNLACLVRTVCESVGMTVVGDKAGEISASFEGRDAQFACADMAWRYS
jgi:hypothetical protein